MSDLIKIAKDSVKGGFFLFLGLASQTIIGVVFSIAVARLLGPEKFGLYSIALVIPTFFISLSDFGISPALTNFLAKLHREGKDYEASSLIKTGLAFKIIISIILSSIIFSQSKFFAETIVNRPTINQLIVITGFFFIGQSLLTSINSIFVSLDEAEKNSLLKNINSITKLLLAIYLISIGYGLKGPIIAIGSASILTTMIGLIIILTRTLKKLEKNKPLTKVINHRTNLWNLLTYGAPIYASALIINVQGRIKSILLANFVADANIGNYNIATNFRLIITMLAFPMATALFPAFSKLNIEKEPETVKRMFELSVKYTSLILIPASIIIAISSKKLVNVMYGAQYETAPLYLTFIMLGYLTVGLGDYVIGALFNSQGQTKTTLKIFIVNFIISIPLSILLIPLYGVMGLIVSNFLTMILSTIYYIHLLNRRFDIQLNLSSYSKIVTSSLLSGIPSYIMSIYSISNNMIIQIIIIGLTYVISYLLISPLIGAINIEDVNNFDLLTKEIKPVHFFFKYIIRIEKNIIKLRSNKK